MWPFVVGAGISVRVGTLKDYLFLHALLQLKKQNKTTQNTYHFFKEKHNQKEIALFTLLSAGK